MLRLAVYLEHEAQEQHAADFPLEEESGFGMTGGGEPGKHKPKVGTGDGEDGQPRGVHGPSLADHVNQSVQP